MCRIIIVDDSPEQVELSKKVLEKGGDEVEGFSNPFMALSAAIDKHPDVVITDQCMPLMEGSQLIREMKKAGIHAKFIILSGLSGLSRHPDMNKGLVDCFLEKPVQISKLLQVVHDSCGV